jgi:hypothetical protein
MKLPLDLAQPPPPALGPKTQYHHPYRLASLSSLNRFSFKPVEVGEEGDEADGGMWPLGTDVGVDGAQARPPEGARQSWGTGAADGKELTEDET